MVKEFYLLDFYPIKKTLILEKKLIRDSLIRSMNRDPKNQIIDRFLM